MTMQRPTVVVADADEETRSRLGTAIGQAPLLDLVATLEQLPASDELAADVLLVDAAVAADDDAAPLRALLATRPHLRCISILHPGGEAAVAATFAAGARGCVAADATPWETVEAVLASTHRGVRVGPSTAARLFGVLGAQGAGAGGRARDEAIARIEDVLTARRWEIVGQPIAALASGAIAGYEALARFSAEPRRSPDVWLGEADEVGRRTELELALAGTALDDLDRIPAEAWMSVNLSPAGATSAALPELLRGRDLGRIVIELTDHSQIQDYELVAGSLAPLRDGGLRIAVDDSGQGLASLHQVARLRPDFIKLNRSLTSGIERDATRRALAYALLSFAAQIGTEVIAEGIESTAELETLRGLGIGHGQGYLIARPAPFPEPGTEAATLADHAAPSRKAVELDPLTGRARRDVREACAGVLRMMEAELPPGTFAVSFLDYQTCAVRILDVRGGEGFGLEHGTVIQLDDSFDARMVTGHGPAVCNDAATDEVYGRLAPPGGTPVGSYVGAPVELADGTRVGALSAMSAQLDAFDERHLEIVRALAAPLAAAIDAEAAAEGGEVGDRLRRLARIDQLTGAINRATFLDVLRSQWLVAKRERRETQLLRVRIAGLDELRARAGHAVGDLLVKDLGRSLLLEGESLDIVGRLDDDELAMLLVARPAADSAAWLSVALTERLAELGRKRDVAVTLAIGSVRVRAAGSVEDALATAEPAPQRAGAGVAA